MGLGNQDCVIHVLMQGHIYIYNKAEWPSYFVQYSLMLSVKPQECFDGLTNPPPPPLFLSWLEHCWCGLNTNYVHMYPWATIWIKSYSMCKHMYIVSLKPIFLCVFRTTANKCGLGDSVYMHWIFPGHLVAISDTRFTWVSSACERGTCPALLCGEGDTANGTAPNSSRPLSRLRLFLLRFVGVLR